LIIEHFGGDALLRRVLSASFANAMRAWAAASLQSESLPSSTFCSSPEKKRAPVEASGCIHPAGEEIFEESVGIGVGGGIDTGGRTKREPFSAGHFSILVH